MTPLGQAESTEICLNVSDLGANRQTENKEKKNRILSARLKVKYQVRGLERFARRPNEALTEQKAATSRRSTGTGGGAESGIVAPWKGKWSRPISRVLSRTVIHLGRPSPNASSDLPGDTCGPQAARGAPPYLVLLQRGFAVPSSLPKTRCALTAPFQPYLPPERVWRHRRYAFCCTFRRFASPRRYLASSPVEPGLSSAASRRPRSSGRLRDAP